MGEEALLVKREGDFYYPIYFKKDFSDLSLALSQTGLGGRRICVVTDSHVSPLYLETVKTELERAGGEVLSFVFPAGEEHKSLDTVKELYRFLIRQEMDRTCLLAALGGGVTGDLTGYAAATYLRGVDFIQIPTTLLAQVDSSVGGKTGVDFEQYKNMVGAFHQPRLVYMNMSTLCTLPEVEFSCGMGEILKTGLICDKEFFCFVVGSREAVLGKDGDVLSDMIRRCCAIKAGIVERDPREKGERALLNLGHTIGHAVEKLMDFQLLHGQCVGLGLVAAARISRNRGLLTEQEEREIREGCAAYGLSLSVSGLEPASILRATKKDKKMVQGKVKFILMDGLGKSFIDTSLTEEEILAGIREICS
ncbi:MAG: 3-dehydroquinate synthase [Eubacteriales bacterium]|nr:3-dehydroquinate synthase [Eubacteriales bacterium]